MEKTPLMPPFEEMGRQQDYARFRMIFEPHALSDTGAFEQAKKSIVKEGENVFVVGQTNILYVESSDGTQTQQKNFDAAFAMSGSALVAYGAALFLDRSKGLASLVDNPLERIVPQAQTYIREMLRLYPDPEFLYRIAQLVAVDRLNKKGYHIRVVSEQSGGSEDPHYDASRKREGFGGLDDYKNTRLHQVRISENRNKAIVADLIERKKAADVSKKPTNMLLMMGSAHSDIAVPVADVAPVQAVTAVWGEGTGEYLKRSWDLQHGIEMPDDVWQEEFELYKKAILEMKEIQKKIAKIVDKVSFT